MGKIKYVFIALIISIASLGIGFAYSGTIVVAATAPTEALNVCVREVEITYNGRLTTETEAADGSVRFTIGGMYPGAEATLHVKIVNLGQHDARFRSAEINMQGNKSLMNYLQVEGGFQVDYNGDRRIDDGTSVSGIWEDLGSLAQALNDSPLRNTMLAPGGVLYLGNPQDGVQDVQEHEFKIKLSESAPNALQNVTASFELKLYWEQAVTDLDEDSDDSVDQNKDKDKKRADNGGHVGSTYDLSSHWSGLIELRWRKVMDLRTQGWRVYGDLYLISKDGSRLPFVTGAVRDSFQRYEKSNGQPQSFVVTVGQLGRCYTVEAPREPSTMPVTVLESRLILPINSLPPQVAPPSLVRADAPQYAYPVGQNVTKGGPETNYPQFFTLNRPLYPGVTQLHSLR